MGMINIEKVRLENEKKLDDDIIKEEYLNSEEEAFREFHQAKRNEYKGRAKFNGKLVVIISLVILLIFFVIYMCTTSISDVVKKNTGESVVSAECKLFIIDENTY